MFTSTRNKNTKYKQFEVIVGEDNIHFDVDKVLHHFTDSSGLLTVKFEDEAYMVFNDWSAIRYSYNKPQ